MCKALILLGSILKIMRGFYLKRMPDSEERTFIEFCKYHQLIMNKANAIVDHLRVWRYVCQSVSVPINSRQWAVEMHKKISFHFSPAQSIPEVILRSIQPNSFHLHKLK